MQRAPPLSPGSCLLCSRLPSFSRCAWPLQWARVVLLHACAVCLGQPCCLLANVCDPRVVPAPAGHPVSSVTHHNCLCPLLCRCVVPVKAPRVLRLCRLKAGGPVCPAGRVSSLPPHAAVLGFHALSGQVQMPQHSISDPPGGRASWLPPSLNLPTRFAPTVPVPGTLSSHLLFFINSSQALLPCPLPRPPPPPPDPPREPPPLLLVGSCPQSTHYSPTCLSPVRFPEGPEHA